MQMRPAGRKGVHTKVKTVYTGDVRAVICSSYTVVFFLCVCIGRKEIVGKK